MRVRVCSRGRARAKVRARSYSQYIITSAEGESPPRVSKALNPVRTVMRWSVRQGVRMRARV